MKRLYPLLLLCCFAFNANAQLFIQGAGTPSVGLGHAKLNTPNAWTAFNHASGMQSVEGFSAGAFVSQLYELDDFINGGLAFTLNNPMLNVGVAYIQGARTQHLRNHHLALSLSKDLHRKFTLGLQAYYFSSIYNGTDLYDQEYLFANVDLQYQVSDDLMVGLRVDNPVQFLLTDLHSTVERISRHIIAGLFYQYDDNYDFYLETAIGENEQVYIAGISACLLGTFTIRGGVNVNNSTLNTHINYTLGMGFEINGMQLNVGVFMHESLGNNRSIGLDYHHF